MKVLFRVDASPTIGMGHLMRCLALAQTLEKSAVQTFFAVSESALSLCKNRDDWVGEILVVPKDIEFSEEALWLDSVISEHKIDALVLDGYQFTKSYRQSLLSFPCCKILFDDNNNSGSLHCDLVINGAENAPLLGYQHSAPNALYCLGSHYRILRQEFIDTAANNWENRHLLTICMGGSDPKKLTLPLLEALHKEDFKAQICVITGGAYQELSKLKSFIAKSHMSLEHIHNCQNMADIFRQSRFVVSAAGGSQFELLACQTPGLLLVVADNQLNATQQASQQGWCAMVDAREMLDFDLLGKQIHEQWHDEEKLKSMYLEAKQYKDVEGSQRVVEAIITLVKKQRLVEKGC
ncbi:MAG: UDP-2,4-diacetamido-2,4,6-trideoxy-beta-L-altropyranose hydrolase [Paraglaciecola sp.]